MYETKVILAMLSRMVGKAKSVKEAYNEVVRAANVEGMALPSYEQFLMEEKEDEE